MDKLFEKNKLHVDISEHNKNDSIKWAAKTTVSKRTVKRIIQDDMWRMCENINY
jgi:hypothetical protein